MPNQAVNGLALVIHGECCGNKIAGLSGEPEAVVVEHERLLLSFDKPE